jgi:HSP20 family protein
MANITPFSNLRDIVRLDPFRDFDDLFRGLRLRPALRDVEFPAEIKVDVAEDEKAYTVKANIPGVSKEDIQVSVDGNVVAITAEVKKEKEEKGKNSIVTERYYGRQYRSFSLDHDIDDGKAEASYKDGVLQLTLPKRAGTTTKKLTVS